MRRPARLKIRGKRVACEGWSIRVLVQPKVDIWRSHWRGRCRDGVRGHWRDCPHRYWRQGLLKVISLNHGVCMSISEYSLELVRDAAV